VVQAFNGVSYGALLFFLGSGLSLIFGAMRIVNLSHGAYFLWGGYIALSVIHATGSWALSMPVAALAVALIRMAIRKRPLHHGWPWPMMGLVLVRRGGHGSPRQTSICVESGRMGRS
jgi:branched-subunit amino acid ABC-type transport system permease component